MALKNYTIYFEFVGKKMRMNIPAENEKQAFEILKGKIKLVKCQDNGPVTTNEELKKSIQDLLDKIFPDA